MFNYSLFLAFATGHGELLVYEKQGSPERRHDGFRGTGQPDRDGVVETFSGGSFEERARSISKSGDATGRGLMKLLTP